MNLVNYVRVVNTYKEKKELNLEETVDILVETIVESLGYSKKYDSGVRKLYGNFYQYCVELESKRMIFKVYKFGDTVPEDKEVGEEGKYFDFVVYTDGKQFHVTFIENGEQLVYKIEDLTNVTELDDMNVLNLLSYKAYNKEKLKELIKERLEELANIDKYMDLYKKDIAGLIATRENNKQFEDRVISWIDGKVRMADTVNNTSYSKPTVVYDGIASKREAESTDDSEESGRISSIERRELELIIESIKEKEIEEDSSMEEVGSDVSIEEHIEHEETEEVSDIGDIIGCIDTSDFEVTEDYVEVIASKDSGLVEELRENGVQLAESELDDSSREIVMEMVGELKEEHEEHEKHEELLRESSEVGENTDVVTEECEEVSFEEGGAEFKGSETSELDSHLNELNEVLNSIDETTSSLGLIEHGEEYDDYSEHPYTDDNAHGENVVTEKETGISAATVGADSDNIENGSVGIVYSVSEPEVAVVPSSDSIDLDEKDLDMMKLDKDIESSISYDEMTYDERMEESKRLLSLIRHYDGNVKSYVAVINNNVLQRRDIYKFVGTCIETLYEVLQADIMQVLFDGELFTILTEPKRRDFVINNKPYDLKLDGLSNQEVLNKLEMLFSRFSEKVIFLYKVVGDREREVEKKLVNNGKGGVGIYKGNLKELKLDGLEIQSIVQVGIGNDLYFVKSKDGSFGHELSKTIKAVECIFKDKNLHETFRNIDYTDREGKQLRGLVEQGGVTIGHSKYKAGLDITEKDYFNILAGALSEIDKDLIFSLTFVIEAIDTKMNNTGRLVDKIDIKDTIEYTEPLDNSIKKFGTTITNKTLQGLSITSKSLNIFNKLVKEIGIVKYGNQMFRVTERGLSGLVSKMFEEASKRNLADALDLGVLGKKFISEDREVNDNFEEVELLGKTYYINNSLGNFVTALLLLKLDTLIKGRKDMMLQVGVVIDANYLDYLNKVYRNFGNPAEESAINKFVSYLIDKVNKK